MKKKWTFKPGRRPLAVEAAVISKELRRVEKKCGELRPKHVVEESRPKAAPLHPLFEWDNTKAAEEYRLHQARNIINIVQVTSTDTTGRKTTVPEFINVSSPSEDEPRDRVYQPVEIAMADDDTRRQIIESCLRKLLMVRDNYRHLLEFGKVWSAIDALDAELVKV